MGPCALAGWPGAAQCELALGRESRARAGAAASGAGNSAAGQQRALRASHAPRQLPAAPLGGLPRRMGATARPPCRPAHPSLPAGQGCNSAPDWLLWGLGRVRAVAGHALELEPRGKGQRDHHGQVPAVIVPGLGPPGERKVQRWVCVSAGAARGGQRWGDATKRGATPEARTVPRYMVIRQVTQMYPRHTSWLCSSAASRPLRPLEWSPEEVPWGLLIAARCVVT